MNGRPPTLLPRDDRERRVIKIWRQSGLADGTIANYLNSVRRFRRHWRMAGIDEIERLNHGDVIAYARAYIGPRRGRRVKEWSRRVARNAMHAWSCALQILGFPVPRWHPEAMPRRWSPLVAEYGEFRRAHRGVAAVTLVRDQAIATEFIGFLRLRGRRVTGARIREIDQFVDELSSRLSRRTVAGLCSSLRCFLRFLRATGRVACDLASGVAAPRYRTDERPPRDLQWESIRRILRAIPRDKGIGRRDYAMLLLLATYGLGAGEVIRLRLDDIDWHASVLHVRRPKTAVTIELPLLAPVARALAAYLRRGRSADSSTREIFVTKGLPHQALTSSAVRHQVCKYARRAGVTVSPLGAHVFRHSHATRQVDAGVPAKIVGDILGHRRPSSTSVYIRLALRRLRTVGLPVPR
jgi:integrase/recombinase XerD